MERESFEDQDVARILNEAFVSIKVDREERPDVDATYMTACQVMTGSGGWPLSVFLDADKKPFFAGTYFPKYDRYGMPGFLSVLESVARAFKERRAELDESARRIIAAMEPRHLSPLPIDADIPHAVFRDLQRSFDAEYGGFSLAPKFPTPHILLFLMRYHALTKNAEALAMCRKTLDCMRRGGIFDHVGFGFSRYSTDRKWLVPHFEKMLYDNALLCMAYAEFYALTAESEYAAAAREILTYLSDKMRSENGGFYSAEDADSEGVEGKFYVWSEDEARAVLGKDAEEFCALFDITDKGNFEGKNIPNLIHGAVPAPLKDFAEKCRVALYAHREKRVRPHLDDKILTSQNGLVVAALAVAGRALGNGEYIEQARQTVSFFTQNMMTPDGRLLLRYRDNEARFPGCAEDYAFFIWGLIELYEACFDIRYLDLALSLNRVFVEHFHDGEQGGFFLADRDSEKLPVRKKESYDGATPSANSVAACNLIRLSRLSHDEGLQKLAERTLGAFMGDIGRSPAAHAFGAIGILHLSHGGSDVVLTSRARADLRDMTEALLRGYHPFTTVLALTGEDDAEKKAADLGYDLGSDGPRAYVCRGFACSPSVGTAKELEALLNQGR